jgi:hypothetical protein
MTYHLTIRFPDGSTAKRIHPTKKAAERGAALALKLGATFTIETKE